MEEEAGRTGGKPHPLTHTRPKESSGSEFSESKKNNNNSRCRVISGREGGGEDRVTLCVLCTVWNYRPEPKAYNTIVSTDGESIGSRTI